MYIYIYIYAKLTFLGPTPSRERPEEDFYTEKYFHEKVLTTLRRCRRRLETIVKPMENNDFTKARGCTRYACSEKTRKSMFSTPRLCAGTLRESFQKKTKNSIYIRQIDFPEPRSRPGAPRGELFCKVGHFPRKCRHRTAQVPQVAPNH